MKLDLGILVGAESKAWLVDLTKLVERMERVAGKSGKAVAAADSEAEETDAPEEAPAEEEEDFAPKKKTASKKAAAAAFEEEEEETEAPEAEEEEEADFTAPPAKKAAAKQKKLTVDDVNDACKALASSIGGKPGRAKVLAILKKNFKTESVSELKPEQYAACVAAMAV
jgi:hypothetical protein